jgi:AbrB family looped-hinge helix DNA binding protein
MKITSKGQVTIPQSVREQAGLHPHSEVEFDVRPKAGGGDAEFEVVIRPIAKQPASVREAFERVRGSANANQFKGMKTDDFMLFLRG